MVVNKSIEEAVVVCLMLAVQQDHVPVGSSSLSDAMNVSDSYLKKTLRKLVVAGLVNSVAGKEGGFTLARSAEQITVGDVFRAMEGDAFRFKGSSLAKHAFMGCPNLPTAEIKTSALISEAGDAFLAKLDEHPLSELLRTGTWINGARDWRM